MSKVNFDLKRLAALKRQREEVSLHEIQLLLDNIDAQQVELAQTMDGLGATPVTQAHLINPTHIFRLRLVRQIQVLEDQKSNLLLELDAAKTKLRKALYSEERIQEIQS